jgi:hypothetical protein
VGARGTVSFIGRCVLCTDHPPIRPRFVPFALAVVAITHRLWPERIRPHTALAILVRPCFLSRLIGDRIMSLRGQPDVVIGLFGDPSCPRSNVCRCANWRSPRLFCFWPVANARLVLVGQPDPQGHKELQVSKDPQVLKGRLVRRDHPVPWAPRERPDYKVPQVPRASAARLDLRDHLE